MRAIGGKALLSAHDGHVNYVASMPAEYPKPQGAFLHESLGKDYLVLGATFNRGSCNAMDNRDPQYLVRVFTVGPAPAGNPEQLLDQVPYRDLVDLRRLPVAAKTALAAERPTRQIGTDFPYPACR